MITYISIIALTGSLSAAIVDETELQSVQNEVIQTHIAQADTATSDDESDTVEYIEWTFL